jgi:sialic acid synthase
MYNSPYNSENAFGPTYGLHREALEFDWDDYRILQDYCDGKDITFFATAFDVPSLEFLVKLGVPVIKIASGDLKSYPLLFDVRASGKPFIVSTGGGCEFDIACTQETFNPNVILHCTSGYPARYDQLNLRCIPMLRADFPKTLIGWSAHDTGIAMAPVAYAMGACIIEKHFTLNRTWKGTDQAFSLEPQGMRTMIENLKQCREALGDGVKRVYDSECEALKKQWKNFNGQIDGKGL